MQTNILLVRHGQTKWNLQQRLQGHKNSPLTAKGQQQARAVRHALQKFTISKAYSSPLPRALQTAEIITAKKHIPITLAADLKEIRLGPWEGMTKQATALSHPEQYDFFWHMQDKFMLEGAETFSQLRSRVVRCLDKIFHDNQGMNILVVSHWIAIKVAMAHYTTQPLARLSNIPDPGNGSYVMLTTTDTNQVTLDIPLPSK